MGGMSQRAFVIAAVGGTLLVVLSACSTPVATPTSPSSSATVPASVSPTPTPSPTVASSAPTLPNAAPATQAAATPSNPPDKWAKSERENVGTVPSGFALASNANQATMDALDPCGLGQVNLPGLNQRVFSRMGQVLNPNLENGALEAALVMSSPATAQSLMGELRERLNACPTTGTKKFQGYLTADGQDEALALLTQEFDAAGAPVAESYGTHWLAVRKGRSIAIYSTWTIAGRPLTDKWAPGGADDPAEGVAKMLAPLPA
ncbi:MAG TPA: hypothetical protein DEG88_13285 [Propionibacteriaceae bacterium]|nr:hypothetical protein [Propionibacteriaceae bacterium]